MRLFFSAAQSRSRCSACKHPHLSTRLIYVTIKTRCPANESVAHTYVKLWLEARPSGPGKALE